jgi:hypothetical protein
MTPSPFNSFKVGDIVILNNKVSGLVSFVDLEYGTLSVLVYKSDTHRSKDVNVVVSRAAFDRGYTTLRAVHPPVDKAPHLGYD